MQDICIVRECGAEARHYVRSSKKVGQVYPACGYHASGVYVFVGKVFGGTVSIGISFSTRNKVVRRSLTQGQGRHELAG